MTARIYRPARTAMQSGKAKSRSWTLEFEPTSPNFQEPLMGWSGSTDMNGQIHLTFDSREEAVEYAQKHGIPFRVQEPQEPRLVLKAYADNFSPRRKQPWTH